MPRNATLQPLLERPRNRWYIYLPAKLSATGKPKREYFPTKKEAEERAQYWKRMEKASASVIRRAGPKLLESAVNYDEIFREIYGIQGGLEEACETYMKLLDSEQQTSCFGELVKAYESENYHQWAKGTQSAWRAHRGHFKELEDRVTSTLTTEFWRGWLSKKAEERSWNNSNYNGVRSRLSTIYKSAIPDLVDSNPIDGVKPRKVEKKAVAVYSIEQVEAVLQCAWKHDREVLPYFAIGIFAGLRPESELGRLQWEDINFDEKWIRVAANYDNKTQTKRFVPIEPNLLAWIEPWKGQVGDVVPKKNFTKRRRWITRGKYQSPSGTPETEWTEVAPYGDNVHDITRHTYGSFLDAKYRDRSMVKENMGHTKSSPDAKSGRVSAAGFRGKGKFGQRSGHPLFGGKAQLPKLCLGKISSAKLATRSNTPLIRCHSTA